MTVINTLTRPRVCERMRRDGGSVFPGALQHCPGENSCIGETPTDRERTWALVCSDSLVEACRFLAIGLRKKRRLANEFGEAQVQHCQGIQTSCEAQEQIGNHRGDDLQADGIVIVADELAKIEMLLDPAKQEFDLPAALVESRDFDCRAF